MARWANSRSSWRNTVGNTPGSDTHRDLDEDARRIILAAAAYIPAMRRATGRTRALFINSGVVRVLKKGPTDDLALRDLEDGPALQSSDGVALGGICAAVASMNASTHRHTVRTVLRHSWRYLEEVELGALARRIGTGTIRHFSAVAGLR